MLVEVEINRTDLGVYDGGDLLFHFCRSFERPLHRGMQPPLPPTSHKRGTAQFHAFGEIPPGEADFDPTPHTARPDFEQDPLPLTLFPLPRIEDGGLVPLPWRDWRASGKLLAFCLGFFPFPPPFGQMSVEGAGRAQRRM